MFQYVGYARKYVHPKIGTEAAAVLQVRKLFIKSLANWTMNKVFSQGLLSITAYDAAKFKHDPLP